MTTIFHTTLRPILFISKCIGLVDISYTVEPSGLLVLNENSIFLAFLEITRMIVLLICTYIYFNQFEPEIHIIQIINIVQFWNTIIAARLSIILTIKYLFIMS